MIVDELMTRKVMAVHPEATLAEAAKIMLAQKVSGLPVVDMEGRLMGMLTEADLLCRAELHTEGKPVGWLVSFLHPGRMASDYVHAHGRHVEEVMTREPISVTPGTALAEAARLMHDERLKRLPVVEKGRLVGIISRFDLLRALTPRLAESGALEPGETIRAYIEDALQKEKWASRSPVRVVVEGDVVTLDGIVFSESERQALKVLAENAPGVKAVRDQLTLIDPASGMAYPFY